MPLLGNGVAAIWHDIDAQSEPDYHHWHCHEHIPERVGIEGFLRGRRYVSVEGGLDGLPAFFHFYETESLATLTSPALPSRSLASRKKETRRWAVWFQPFRWP